jgi:hypothetical protein
MIPPIYISCKAKDLHAELVNLITRWDGRYIPPADKDGFSLHIHKSAEKAPYVDAAGVPRSNVPAPAAPFQESKP